MMKILLIEDEPELADVIRTSLEKELYLVEHVLDFNSAMDKISIYEYDCILLDIMLPGGSGLEILEELKKNKIEGNVIIISAKDSLEDKLAGLGLGADDYLTKPFHIAELNARIKAVFRRKNLSGSSSILTGNTVLDLNERLFLVDRE